MDLQCEVTIDTKQGALRAVRFNVDGSYCLTCGSDKKIKLWNPYRKLMLKCYGGHGNEVLDVAGSCDSSQIVSCSSDKSVILWDVSTGQALRYLRGHGGSVCCVKFNEESTVAISGSHDNTIMCWDVRSRKSSPIQTLHDAKDCISSIQVTDHEILTSSFDCHTRVYDLRMGKVYADFIGASITCACFTHDGQCVVVSTADSTIRLIEKHNGELLATYSGHETEDYSIESFVSIKDTHILSGSATGEIWCWDLMTSKVATKYYHATNAVVHSLCGHPNQEKFLSASKAELKLWSPKNNEDISIIEI